MNIGVGGMLCALGFFPYILGVVQGKNKPPRVSWLIWALLDGVNLAAMAREGTVNSQLAVAFFGAALVLGVSLQYGEKEPWKLVHKLCLVLVGVGLVLWFFLGGDLGPTAGILAASLGTAIGFIPIVISTWREPGREDGIGRALFLSASVATVMAISVWSVANALQPLVFLVGDSVLTGILICRR